MRKQTWNEGTKKHLPLTNNYILRYTRLRCSLWHCARQFDRWVVSGLSVWERLWPVVWPLRKSSHPTWPIWRDPSDPKSGWPVQHWMRGAVSVTLWSNTCWRQVDEVSMTDQARHTRSLRIYIGLFVQEMQQDPWKPREIPDPVWSIFIWTTFGDSYMDISSGVTARQFLYGQRIRPPWARIFGFFAAFVV